MTRGRLLQAVGAIVGLGVTAVLVAGALQIVHRGEVAPSVTVGGVDVGGLGADDARGRVTALARDLESEPVTVTHNDRTWVLAPSDIGFQIDVAGTVAALQRVARDEGTLANLFAHVTTLWRNEDVAIQTTFELDDLDDWLASVAGEVDQAPFPGGLEIDPDTFDVTTRAPREGREVDQSALRTAVVRALVTPGPDEVTLDVRVAPIRIEAEQVAAVADQARLALAEPMVLTHERGDLVVSRPDLAALLTLREIETEGGWDAELHVEPGTVEEVFATRTGAYEVDPVDAGWEVDRKPPVAFDDKSTTSWRKVAQPLPAFPSSPGSTFDIERTAAQIADLARRGERGEHLELLRIDPEFTTAEAEAGRPTHLLSTFTTYHACCQSRVFNIQKLADLVDGAIVLPGEQFSINRISGERRCSRGFVEAGMILRGEIVQSCGGGVSQFGTTTFNAAFFAGMQLDEWKAHSFYISRYPQGREATINLPSPNIDVLWTNTTDAPVLVKTSYTGRSITVSLWGQSDVDEVEAVHGRPTRWTNWSTEYRENKSLAPGSQRTIQSGQRGFTVVVVRKVHRGNDVEEQEIVTVYLPERQIVERNTDPAPDPTDEPSEAPTQPKPKPKPDPTPDPTPSETDGGLLPVGRP